jgi:hypothetical protein
MNLLIFDEINFFGVVTQLIPHFFPSGIFRNGVHSISQGYSAESKRFVRMHQFSGATGW